MAYYQCPNCGEHHDTTNCPSTSPTPPEKRPSPGWLCPACGAGNAPWVAQCPCKWRGEALLNPMWTGNT